MRHLPALFSMGKIKLGLAAAVFAASGLAIAPLAHATPINFYNNPSTSDTLRFTITCDDTGLSGDCSQLQALYDLTPTWDTSKGGMFELSNAGDSTERDFVNGIAGTSFSSGVKTDGSSSDTFDFTTSADYILFKTGNPNHDLGRLGWALLYNESGGQLDLSFVATEGTGSGLSHYVQYGGSTPGGGGGGGGGGELPEPSSLGILGLGLLFIAGLAIRARRERRSNAE